MSDGSLLLRSPGMATTRVPPVLGVPSAAWLAGALAGVEAAGAWLSGAVDGAVVGAGVAVDPPHAATRMAPAAISAPIRTRDMRAPPPTGWGDRRIARRAARRRASAICRCMILTLRS